MKRQHLLYTSGANEYLEFKIDAIQWKLFSCFWYLLFTWLVQTILLIGPPLHLQVGYLWNDYTQSILVGAVGLHKFSQHFSKADPLSSKLARYSVSVDVPWRDRSPWFKHVSGTQNGYFLDEMQKNLNSIALDLFCCAICIVINHIDGAVTFITHLSCTGILGT